MSGNVYIQFDPWGRMGNRMFQLAFGYILSCLRKCNLYHDGISNFNVSGIKGVPSGHYLNTKKYGDHRVDMTELSSTSLDVVVDSFVQRAEYYIPYREELRKFFNYNKPYKTINKNKLVVHIRETDYIQINSFLGYKVYKDIITKSGFSDIIIVTDNSTCETVQRLVSEGCVINTHGYVSEFSHNCDSRGMLDFETLMFSENIAISQSSFSWWAAFLGFHQRAIFPFTETPSLWKYNPGEDDIDLFFNSPETIKMLIA